MEGMCATWHLSFGNIDATLFENKVSSKFYYSESVDEKENNSLY